MKNNSSIERYNHRYKNFFQAYNTFFRLVKAYKKEVSEISEMALIQAFEFTLEITWKILKDYIEVEGISVKSPRETIKHAFQQEIITEGETWLKAIEVRNNTTHTYDEILREEAVLFIVNEFAPQLESLYPNIKEKYETWSF